MANVGPSGNNPPTEPGFSPPPPLDEPPASQAVRPPRPLTVTVAGNLLFVVAALGVLAAIVNFASNDLLVEAYSKLPGQQGQPGPESMASFAVWGSVGIAVVGLIAFVTLGLLVLRGNNVARIITWVVCGLFLCCSGIGVVGQVSTPLEMPGWYTSYSVVSILASFLIYIAVVVLLALPVSNAYFKPKPQGQLY